MSINDGFEERLLAELKQVVAERATPAEAPARRIRFGWKPRLALALGAAVIGVAIAVAMQNEPVGKAPTPAYAVTVQEDGKVRIDIHDFRDTEGLERELARVGITAQVDNPPPGKMCKQPRFVPDVDAYPNPPGGWTPYNLEIHSEKSATLTLDPAQYRGKTVVMTIVTYLNDPNRLATIGVAFAAGEVKPCEPVDIPPIPGVTTPYPTSRPTNYPTPTPTS